MKYTIKLTWNDSVVLEGKCSAVLAYETVRHFLLDNFSGRLLREKGHELPSLDRLATADNGVTFGGIWADETGRATYELTRVPHE